MNEGIGGGYGFLMIILVAGAVLTVLGVLGAAMLRGMLRDDIYFPEER